MANYTCPYATQVKGMRFLSCKAMIEGSSKESNVKIASTAFCAFQRFCPQEKRPINTEAARECYADKIKKLNKEAIVKTATVVKSKKSRVKAE